MQFPTRKNNFLDLLLTNRPGLLVNCEPVPGFGDHDTAVLANINCHPQRLKPTQRKVFCWDKADTTALREQTKKELQSFSNAETINSPINSLWNKFKLIILNCQEKFVPSKTTSKRFNQPWFNRKKKCKRATRKKIRRYRVFKRYKSEINWKTYQEAARTCRRTCNASRDEYVKSTVAEDGKNTKKKVYAFIKYKKQGITGVSPLHDQHGKTQTDDEEIAKILNNQFASVFSQDDGLSPPIGGPVGANIADLIVNRNGVLKLLREIDTHKSTGPDNVSAKLLHELAEEVADPLVLIFNASLTQGRVPDDWKHATITPLYKGGNKNRSVAESYRPISLTSISCKIMEHVLHSHMINHLEREGILTDTQHGFRKNRSCETQLLQTVDSFAKSLNNKEQVDAILLDFSKAFDKVCHRKLVQKLHHYGIKGKLLNWIEHYLADRTQCVVVRGKSSPRTHVQSGVPQGTVLGPLLFLAYINDMPYSVSSSLALFADDSFLHKIIREVTDGRVLQKDLDELSVWETNWSMEFHPKKCKVLRITNKRASKKCTKYTLHNEELEVVDKAKYLGVTISKDLNWKWHINSISAKATNCRLFLQRNLVKCSKETKLSCYKTFIRPILEYACTVWCPHSNASLTNKLEMVQRKTARWILNKWHHTNSPTQMLKELDLPTLQSRREVSCVKMLFEIMYGFKYVDNSMIPKRQRCLNTKFVPVHAKLQSYERSFIPATIKLWNQLPPGVANESDRKPFLNKLR